MDDIPQHCQERACWARVETWCPLCEKFLCVPHDSRHVCLGHQEDEEWGPDSAQQMLERGPR